MQVLAALAAGLVFGLGLILSQMINPEKVLAFLDVTGRWDPSLAFVLAGAAAVSGLGYFLARRRGTPLLATEATKIERDYTTLRRRYEDLLAMRDNACSSLYRVNIERKNYLDKRTALLRERDETAEVERLKSENARLNSDKQNMQNTVNMLRAQAASHWR